jgi:hypothetical protein
MLLFSISLGIVVGIISDFFPAFNLFALIAGAVTIVIVGKRTFKQGDSNETQSNRHE